MAYDYDCSIWGQCFQCRFALGAFHCLGTGVWYGYCQCSDFEGGCAAANPCYYELAGKDNLLASLPSTEEASSCEMARLEVQPRAAKDWRGVKATASSVELSTQGARRQER